MKKSKNMRKVKLPLLAVVILLVGLFIQFIAYGAAQLPSSPTQKHNKDITVAAGSSTSTIQQAINDASAAGGGTVTLASGTYNITVPLELKSNVTLIGARKDVTVLKRTNDLGTGESVITVTVGGLKNVIVKNLTIDANYQVDPATNPAPDSWKNGGVLITDGSNGSNDLILFENVKVKNGTMGFHVKGTSNLTIIGCDFTNNGGCYLYWHNVYLRRVSKALIDSSNMNWSNSGNGVNISYSDNITIRNSKSYNNYFRGIRAADSSYIDILSNQVYNNQTGDGIIMNAESNGVTNFRIHSNTVSNNGGYGIRTTSQCSNGEVWYNIDGGGNKNGFMLIEGTNISIK